MYILVSTLPTRSIQVCRCNICIRQAKSKGVSPLLLSTSG